MTLTNEQAEAWGRRWMASPCWNGRWGRLLVRNAGGGIVPTHAYNLAGNWPDPRDPAFLGIALHRIWEVHGDTSLHPRPEFRGRRTGRWCVYAGTAPFKGGRYGFSALEALILTAEAL